MEIKRFYNRFCKALQRITFDCNSFPFSDDRACSSCLYVSLYKVEHNNVGKIIVLSIAIVHCIVIFSDNFDLFDIVDEKKKKKKSQTFYN